MQPDACLRRLRSWGLPIFVLLLWSLSAAPAAARGCLQLGNVTAFTPRGEVYVEVSTACEDADFGGEDLIVSRVEVLVNDLPPVSEDVIVYGGEPPGSETFLFQDLPFESGSPILVRLVRFGTIQGLKTIKAP